MVGLVSVQTETFVKGPQTRNRRLVLVAPTRPFHMELVAELGVAREGQSWQPPSMQSCQSDGTPLAVPQALVLAKVYAEPTQATRRGCRYCCSGPGKGLQLWR